MPYTVCDFSYEVFSILIEPFCNDRTKMDIKTRRAAIDPNASLTLFPQEENCQILSFSIKKSKLYYTDLNESQLAEREVTEQNYAEILKKIWKDNVYLMLGRTPTYYLPFKKIMESVVARSTADLTSPWVKQIAEIIPMNENLLQIIAEYCCEEKELTKAIKGFGFLKEPLPKTSKQKETLTEPKSPKTHSF